MQRPQKSIAFFFDYSCPYAYLASTQLSHVAAKTQITPTLSPMLLGGIFQKTGTPQNLSETLSPAKSRHGDLDLARWAHLYGVPVKKPAGHPLRTVDALRATIASGIDPRVVRGFFEAYWVRGEPPSDPAIMARVLRDAGHDPVRILSEAGSRRVKEELRKRTDEAFALGIFGAPAFWVDGHELYWGQDRIHFVVADPWETWLAVPSSPPVGEPPELRVYWDFSSPFAYFGSVQAARLQRHARVVYEPMLLGGLFKKIGQELVPLRSFSEAKQAYIAKDLERWARYLRIPFRFPTRFPMNTVKALRAYLALDDEHKRDAFRERVFRAYWAEDRDISDDRELALCLGEGAEEILLASQSPEIRAELVACTDRAADLGVFGAPTFVVRDRELFWGQDRLPLVLRSLFSG